MKNTIVIDATRNCICDLVSAVDNGENRFFIEIRADTALNPKLQIENEQITITGSTFLYEVGTAYYIGDETLQFRIVDDENVGEYFSIEKNRKSRWKSVFDTRIKLYIYLVGCRAINGRYTNRYHRTTWRYYCWIDTVYYAEWCSGCAIW